MQPPSRNSVCSMNARPQRTTPYTDTLKDQRKCAIHAYLCNLNVGLLGRHLPTENL